MANDIPLTDSIQDEERIALKEYLFIIFKNRWILISIVSVIMVITLISLLKTTPIYRATALILIETPASSLSLATTREGVMPDTQDRDYYNTQYEILKSRMLAKRVCKTLDLKSLGDFAKYEFPEDLFQGMITVEPVKNTRLVRVSVDYKDPAMAATMVNTLVTSYIEQNVENLLFMSKEILKAFPEDAKEVERNTIYGQLKDVSRQEAVDSLPSIVNNLILQHLRSEKIGAETKLADLNRRYKAKHPKIIALNTQIKFINDEITLETDRILRSVKADLAGRLQANNIRVIDYAEIPKSPIKPRVARELMLSFMLSMFGSLGLIYLREYLDDSIRTGKDVESLNLSYLGSFPLLKDAPRDKNRHHRLDDMERNLECYESIRSIRTNIIFSAPSDKLKTILFTSALPKEGKSLMASYTALSFAKNGFKTVILDADIRKPRLHKIFDIPQTPGLINFIVESVTLEDIIKKTRYENLYIIPAGSKTPNPLELIGSEKIKNLIKELGEKFDKLIIDTPPSLHIPDAIVLSKFVDVNILLTKFGMVSRSILAKLKEKFTVIGSRVIGVIVNFSQLEGTSYYDYKYYHKYYKGYYASGDSSNNQTVSKEKAAEYSC